MVGRGGVAGEDGGVPRGGDAEGGGPVRHHHRPAHQEVRQGSRPLHSGPEEWTRSLHFGRGESWDVILLSTSARSPHPFYPSFSLLPASP